MNNFLTTEITRPQSGSELIDVLGFGEGKDGVNEIFNDAPRVFVVDGRGHKQGTYRSCAHHLAVILPCVFISSVSLAGNEKFELLESGGMNLELLLKEFINPRGFMSGAVTPADLQSRECGHECRTKLNDGGTLGVQPVNVKQGERANQTSQQSSGPSRDDDHFEWWAFIGGLVPILMFLADALITPKPNVKIQRRSASAGMDS